MSSLSNEIIDSICCFAFVGEELITAGIMKACKTQKSDLARRAIFSAAEMAVIAACGYRGYKSNGIAGGMKGALLGTFISDYLVNRFNDSFRRKGGVC
jgi:uncharacterized membrane protein